MMASTTNKQHDLRGASLKKVARAWQTRAANYRRAWKTTRSDPEGEKLRWKAELLGELAEDMVAEGDRASGAR